MLSLYPDQQELIDATRKALSQSRAVLMQAATGAGKTVITSFMFKRTVDGGKKALFVVPRRELMNQTSNTFSRLEIEHSFLSAGRPFDSNVMCWIATTESLVRRLDIAPDVDLVVCDEAHVGATSLDKIIKHYKERNSFIIGLSATPWKLSGKGLGCWFDSMACGKSVRWLIDNKRLSDFRIFAPQTPDLSGVKTVAGDYAKGQLANQMENDSVLVGRAVDHYKKHAMGKLSVTFCVSRKHAQITNEQFLASGIPSAYVDGTTPADERKRIFKSLAKREILNVCNCEILTFGFDLSSASEMEVSIESLSILRPTKSLALWNQILGRGLRYKEEPALIFDHSGNAVRLGLPDTPRDWTLEDCAKGSRKSDAQAISIRQCPQCDFVHRPAPLCPDCGYEYPDGGRAIEEIEGELQEVKDRKEMERKRDKKNRRAACKTEEELVAFAVTEGYKWPEKWARRFMEIRRTYRGRQR